MIKDLGIRNAGCAERLSGINPCPYACRTYYRNSQLPTALPAFAIQTQQRVPADRMGDSSVSLKGFWGGAGLTSQCIGPEEMSGKLAGVLSPPWLLQLLQRSPHSVGANPHKITHKCQFSLRFRMTIYSMSKSLHVFFLLVDSHALQYSSTYWIFIRQSRKHSL